MNGKTIKRIFLILILGFVAIFILRFVYNLYNYANYGNIYSYYGYGNYAYTPLASSSVSFDFVSVKGFSNVATERQRISGDKGIEVNYDQKYEMISEIKSGSEDFENDVMEVRKSINDLSGVVQMEQTGGLENNHDRFLWVSVGIPPGKFDSLVEELKLIGTITNFSVNKTDKTAEFKSYLAQIEALEKSVDSYKAIKSQGGTIADLLMIEEKIIKTENELLQMGVTLGFFDESQSLCTVDFTLSEYIDVKRGGIEFYMVVESAVDALGWSLLAYLLIILFGLGTGFAALGGAFIVSKFTKQYPKKEGEKEEIAQVNKEGPREG